MGAKPCEGVAPYSFAQIFKFNGVCVFEVREHDEQLPRARSHVHLSDCLVCLSRIRELALQKRCEGVAPYSFASFLKFKGGQNSVKE